MVVSSLLNQLMGIGVAPPAGAMGVAEVPMALADPVVGVPLAAGGA